MNETEDAGCVFVEPEAYANEARFHEACRHLRATDPVHLVDVAGYDPFWAVTKHADVAAVEVNVSVFRSAPRPILFPNGRRIDARLDGTDTGNPDHGDELVEPEETGRDEENDEVFLRRTLVDVDGEEHRRLRSLTASWFQPSSIGERQQRIEQLARRLVDSAARTEQCDFFRHIAARLPLYTLLDMLGLPDEDAGIFYHLTQTLSLSADDDLTLDESSEADREGDFESYFSSIIDDRRLHPRGDLSSVIANGSVSGSPLDAHTAVSYFVLLATAGHDTAASAIAGGMHALISNPSALDRLRRNPDQIGTAVEEMIRWVTPVKQFMRTATRDAYVGDQQIRAGESVLLSYPSANRDEDVFADPFLFDIARAPNRHLAFGAGAHFCLGAHLARMQMKALFKELLPRLESVELIEEPQWRHSIFLGGLRSLPIRYSIMK